VDFGAAGCMVELEQWEERRIWCLRYQVAEVGAARQAVEFEAAVQAAEFEAAEQVAEFEAVGWAADSMAIAVG